MITLKDSSAASHDYCENVILPELTNDPDFAGDQKVFLNRLGKLWYLFPQTLWREMVAVIEEHHLLPDECDEEMQLALLHLMIRHPQLEAFSCHIIPGYSQLVDEYLAVWAEYGKLPEQLAKQVDSNAIFCQYENKPNLFSTLHLIKRKIITLPPGGDIILPVGNVADNAGYKNGKRMFPELISAISAICNRENRTTTKSKEANSFFTDGWSIPWSDYSLYGWQALDQRLLKDAKSVETELKPVEERYCRAIQNQNNDMRMAIIERFSYEAILREIALSEKESTL